ncbi:MAG TPA: flavodoxin-dependent (E)-4-hydroxy-3-methylbut-2-enyl-diphosphate synthase [Candidatus Coatesbacteria bacterium]|nr:flavodoxin-dependent (E)-4-hydroxy-3-methylbut-2-enyl-diphosphate synthase [Candidatus Coatesbacteria bacterium]
MTKRWETRRIELGGVAIGGGAPVAVQSMTNTPTHDVERTLAQISALVAAGCEIVRLAVPDRRAAKALPELVENSPVPLVADIHFSEKLALASIDAGVAGLRLNPGNLREAGAVRRVARAAAAAQIPIRVGVNAGSLEPDLLAKHGGPTPEALVMSALGEVRLLEDAGLEAIKVSAKASSVTDTIAAYRLLAEGTSWPLHLGVTEAGRREAGVVKSAIGIGVLLLEGIGDTLRVSLTGDPVAEVRTAWEILRACGLRARGVEIISCPTCGRCNYDLEALVGEVERRLSDVLVPLRVAVMGCVVNGPGEAAHADVGVAGGTEAGDIFVRGEIVERGVPAAQLAERLERLVREAAAEREK